MSSQDGVIDLVNEAYATTTDPMRYDAFMDSWEQYIESCLEAENLSSLYDLENSPVHAHFARGLEILDRLGRLKRQEKTAERLVDLALGAGCVVDEYGLVIAANDSAANRIGATTGKNLTETTLDPDATDALTRWIQSARVGEDSFLFVRGQNEKSGTSDCFLASLIPLPISDSRNVFGTERKYFFLLSIDLGFDQSTNQMLIDGFGLSQAEAEVAIALGEGRTPNEVAAVRNASINTIRTQIKKILKKTNAQGIPDLVRILCGFTAGYAVNKSASRMTISLRDNGNTSRSGQVVLPDSRRLCYAEHGKATGVPTLFFHNMLYGTCLTDGFIDACTRQGFRIIAPSRPGFGDSSLNAGLRGAALVDQTARDALYLLDHLKLEKVILIGHVAGSIYAQRFALRYRERTRGLLFVSHAPHWDDAFFDDLPRRQRLLAKSTRYAPAALPFLTRAGVALIDAGGHDHFIHALHKGVVEDMRALRRPDVYGAVVQGLRHTVKRGAAGFCLDCPLVLMDWAPDARGLDVPVHILHGTADQVVTRKYIDGYMRQLPTANLTLVDGAGQYLLYSHWPRILDGMRGVL